MTHAWSGRLIFPSMEDTILKAFRDDMSKTVPSSPMGPKLLHGNVTPSTMKVKNQTKLDMTEEINDQQYEDEAPIVDAGSTVPKPLKLSVRLDNLLRKAKMEPIGQRSERLFGPDVPENRAMKNYERYIRLRDKVNKLKDSGKNVRDKGENIQNSTNSGDLFKTTRNLYSRAMKKCAGTSVAIPGPGGEPMDLIKEEGSKPRKKKKEKK